MTNTRDFRRWVLGGLVMSRRPGHVPVVWIIDVRWIYMWFPQGAIRGPYVYPGIAAGLESPKKFKFPGKAEQEWSLSLCLYLHNVNLSSLVEMTILSSLFPQVQHVLMKFVRQLHSSPCTRQKDIKPCLLWPHWSELTSPSLLLTDVIKSHLAF